MPPVVLFLATAWTLFRHFQRIHRVLSWRALRWRRMVATVFAASCMYAIMGWSYAGLADGTRTFEQHIDVVFWFGAALIVWPGEVLAMQSRREKAERDEILDLMERLSPSWDDADDG